MFGRATNNRVDNSLRLEDDGVIRLTYKGSQTRETLRMLTEKLLTTMAQQRAGGKKVRVLADMRGITGSDSGARLESKWFLEEADWDALAVVGNRYLQPLIFFVLRDFKSGKKLVKYFADEKKALKWLDDPLPDTNFNRLKPHNKMKWAFIVLIVWILVGTVSSWFQVNQRLEVEAKHRFDGVALRSSAAINDRLKVYTEALYGFRGLFHASDTVSEREYHDYFASLGLGDKYPGFNSINFIASVKNAELPAFVEKLRTDRSLRPEGDPSFKITPASSLSEHFIVAYVGVEGGGTNRGIDLATNEERRTTLATARSNGEPTATDTIKLLDQNGQPGQTDGFLVTIPIYKDDVPGTVAQRLAANEGFVSAVFDYEKFFRQAFAGVVPSDVAVRILDHVGAVIYSKNKVNGESLMAKTTILVGGRTWDMQIQASKQYGVSRAEAALPFYVVAFGVTLAGFLASVLWQQNRSRRRAVELASDMTEDIKQERNAATATKNKDEAILSSIGDGVLVLDAEGRIVLFNKAAENITRLLATNVLGQSYRENFIFLDEKNMQPDERFIASALAGKSAQMSPNTVLRRKDGSIVPVADSAAPVHNAEGKTMGAVVIFRDTTRERQLEKMKGELLAVASHELRTPMGAVRANVAMILAGDYGPVNKDLVEPLSDIQASTIRLVELVNDLLNAARLEGGRMKFALAEVDIQELLQGVATSLAPLGKEKGVEITCAPDEKTMIEADGEKIKQVLTNLVGNALKFTEKGQIVLAFSAEAANVEVTVTDSGIGISPHDQLKLFGKFQQITSQQAGKPVGTGLGLYISREMLRRMGGELWIKHSEPGKGSTFAFTIPRPGTPAAEKARTAILREAEAHPDQK